MDDAITTEHLAASAYDDVIVESTPAVVDVGGAVALTFDLPTDLADDAKQDHAKQEHSGEITAEVAVGHDPPPRAIDPEATELVSLDDLPRRPSRLRYLLVPAFACCVVVAVLVVLQLGRRSTATRSTPDQRAAGAASLTPPGRPAIHPDASRTMVAQTTLDRGAPAAPRADAGQGGGRAVAGLDAGAADRHTVVAAATPAVDAAALAVDAAAPAVEDAPPAVEDAPPPKVRRPTRHLAKKKRPAAHRTVAKHARPKRPRTPAKKAGSSTPRETGQTIDPFAE